MSHSFPIKLQGLMTLALCVLAVSLGCGEPAAPPEARTKLEECAPNEGPMDALCTTVEVFENREAVQGRTIDLNVVVFPAFNRNPEPDPLFVLAGGPGQAAARISGQLMTVLEKVQQDRDVVFVDQRGTGKSNGLACDLGDDSLDDVSRTEFPVEKVEKCLTSYDADPRYYTTPIAMDDLNHVRETLGYDKINLWGGSYGTRAALVYVRRHGESVRSVVLDGVAPPTMRLPIAFPRDAHRALDLMLQACEADAACDGRFPKIRGRLTELLDRLERNPPRVKLQHPRTGVETEVTVRLQFAAGVMMGALYSPDLSALLPLLIERAEAGDFQGFLGMGGIGEGVEQEMSRGMFFSVICSEDLPAITPQEAAEKAKGTFMGTLVYEAWGKACAVWPRGEIAPDYHEPVTSDLPVLILSGEFDPVTPPSWGDEAAATLPNSRHVVVPGVGHGTTAIGCVPKLVAEFIDAGSAGGIDASCVEKHKRPPFFLTNAGPAPEGAK
jgi:pimeloyl-ACP methyl ester carboxylesterase